MRCCRCGGAEVVVMVAWCPEAGAPLRGPCCRACATTLHEELTLVDFTFLPVPDLIRYVEAPCKSDWLND